MTQATQAIDYTAIGNAAAEAEDQTKMKEGGGGFDRPVPAQGKAILRLQQYIEVGKQPSNNPKFKDAEQVMLRFELHTPNHLIEIDTEDGKKKIPNTIDVRLPKGGKNSKYGRLFAALNYNGKFNHFAQMVGAGSWLAEVSHNVTNAGTDKEKTYANLDKNKAWTFAAPIVEDPIEGTSKPIPVPELDGDPKVFLWENKGLSDPQYLALWESIFIEGEIEAKGDKPARSKNWIQELITSSLTFEGSRLHKLLEQNPTGADVDEIVEQAEAEATEATQETPVEAEATPETTGEDPLLGLL